MNEDFVSDKTALPTGLLASYQKHAKDNGLTVSQLRVLEAIGLRPGCTQKTLHERLGMPKQRVNLLVRELTQKELLDRRKNDADGRSVLLYLTERGRAVAERIPDTAHRANDPAASAEPHAHVMEDGTVVVHSHGEGHGHAHSHQHTKAVLDRLARSIGHLEKVRQMVEAGEDCSEVLIQLSAVKAAINNTGKLILKDHIEHCVVDAIERGDHRTVEELNKAIDQFIK